MGTDTTYAVDLTDDGRVTHTITDDGLNLVSQYTGIKGSARVTIGWLTIEKAEANYENARTAFMDRIDQIVDRVAELEESDDKHTTSVQKIQTLVQFRGHRIRLFTEAGPPAWKYPRLTMGRDKHGLPRVEFGWLYRAYSIFLEDDQ